MNEIFYLLWLSRLEHISHQRSLSDLEIPTIMESRQLSRDINPRNAKWWTVTDQGRGQTVARLAHRGCTSTNLRGLMALEPDTK